MITLHELGSLVKESGKLRHNPTGASRKKAAESADPGLLMQRSHDSYDYDVEQLQDIVRRLSAFDALNRDGSGSLRAASLCRAFHLTLEESIDIVRKGRGSGQSRPV